MNNVKQNICDAGKEGPVTVSISRKVLPGHEQEFEDWTVGILEAAATFPGYQGASVLRPSDQTQNEYVVIYRFDCFMNGQNWEHSEIRKQWRSKLVDMIEGEEITQKGTGLEFWFDLADLPMNKTPTPYKMAIILVVVLYVLNTLVNQLIVPHILFIPESVRLLLILTALVILLTYFLMPKITYLLRDWLYD